MKTLLLVVAIAGVALVAASHASARVACTPGGHGATRTYCGPAKATMKYRGRTYRFNQGGRCSVSRSNWSINIGTITIAGRPKHAYLGILSFGAKAGTHDAAVSFQLPNGTNASLRNAKVTLARGLKRGTFTGRNPSGRGKSSGSFRCR